MAAAHQTRSPTTLLFVVACIVFVLHAVYLGVVAEDAFITFRFARNLVSGAGLVWNPGEGPVEGYTNFLWLLICAVPIKLGLDVALIAQCSGVAAGLVTMWITLRIGQRVMEITGVMATLPCFLLALSGPFATWAGSGMETVFFTLLVTVGLERVAAWTRCGSAAAVAQAGFVLFLATLTRPEGFGAFGILFGIGLLTALGDRKLLRGWLLGAVAFGLPFGAYFAWRWTHFGYPLPNTFYAKTGGTTAQWIRGAKYVSLFGIHFIVPLVPVVATLALEHGLPARARRLRGHLYEQERKETLPGYLRRNAALAACIALCGAWFAYVTWVGGDYMAMFRFLVPILPALYLATGFAAHRLPERASSVTQRRIFAGLLAIGGGLTFLQSTPLEASIFTKPWWLHGNHRGVQTERWHVNRLSLLGEFFAGELKEGESLAVAPIGAVGWFCDTPIHSIASIVDPVLAHREPEMREMGRGFPGHEKEDIVHALSKKPTMVFYRRHFSAEPAGYPTQLYPDNVLAIMRAEYEPQSVHLEDPANGESGYFNYLVRKDR